MGFRCSVVAVKDLPPDRLLEFFGFERTGLREEFAESDFTLVQALDGWSVLVALGIERVDFFVEEDAKLLSVQTRALYFVSETTSTNTALVAYASNEPSWSIYYDGSDGLTAPEFEGDPPEFVDEFFTKCCEERDAEDAEDPEETDYFYDLTLDVFSRLTGLHLIVADLEDPRPFQELRRVETVESRGESKPSGFFGRRFRRRHS